MPRAAANSATTSSAIENRRRDFTIFIRGKSKVTADSGQNPGSAGGGEQTSLQHHSVSVEYQICLPDRTPKTGFAASGDAEGGNESTKTDSVWRTLIFFFNDTATTEIYTLSLHDALPI